MPAKFDAIVADDDSARHAHIDSRANKAVRETERLCRVIPTRKQLLQAVDYGD